MNSSPLTLILSETSFGSSDREGKDSFSQANQTQPFLCLYRQLFFKQHLVDLIFLLFLCKLSIDSTLPCAQFASKITATLSVAIIALVLLSLAGFSLSSDPCFVETDCQRCVHRAGCNWCWDGYNIGCRRVIDPIQCCTQCEACEEKVRFKAISLGLLVSLLIGSVAVLVVAISYSYYKYYWLQRHYFEVLE
jgi:hypothetical protein